MDRQAFQTISRIRGREARTLLRSGQYSGAYYLLGYSVECALKSCLSKQLRKNDLPDKKFINDAYTHNLEQLLGLSGLRPEFEEARRQDAGLELNWAIVKDWSESSRYDPSITELQARDFFSACTGRRSGVLRWIRERW